MLFVVLTFALLAGRAEADDAPTGPKGSDAPSGAAGQPDGSGEGSAARASPRDRSISEIEEGIRSHNAQFRMCHERELAELDAPAGRIDTFLVIHGDGQVHGVRMLSNNTGNRRLESCLRDEVETIRFDGGVADSVRVQFSFTFHASSRGSGEMLQSSVQVMDAGRRFMQDIKDTIRGKRSEIKACYESELESEPTLAGRLVVKFSIEMDGTVTEFRIESNTSGSRRLESCVRTAIEALRFDVAGGHVHVTYPFVFSSDP